jgi:hypothetical protein
MSVPIRARVKLSGRNLGRDMLVICSNRGIRKTCTGVSGRGIGRPPPDSRREVLSKSKVGTVSDRKSPSADLALLSGQSASTHGAARQFLILPETCPSESS